MSQLHCPRNNLNLYIWAEIHIILGQCGVHLTITVLFTTHQTLLWISSEIPTLLLTLLTQQYCELLLISRVWNLIFWSLKKIDRDQIALVDLWKRSNCSCQSLKKIESLSSIFEKDQKDWIALKKTSDLLKKRIFHMFWAVFPLFMPKDWIAPVFNLRSF